MQAERMAGPFTTNTCHPSVIIEVDESQILATGVDISLGVSVGSSRDDSGGPGCGHERLVDVA
jgi:hypothetical protein